MRLERTIAVMLLATGMTLGGIVLAANPQGEATPGKTSATQAGSPKTALSARPWKSVELKPEHAILKGLVGHWTTNSHVYARDLAHARDTEGTADGKLLMGGLFVEVTHVETRTKLPFEEMQLYGFSAALGKYTSDSINTASTSIMHFVGTYDAAKKQLNLSTHYSDEKLKILTIARTVTTFIDENTWRSDEYITHGTGLETEVVSILFKRGSTGKAAAPVVRENELGK